MGRITRSTLVAAVALAALAGDSAASSQQRLFARWWEQAGVRAAAAPGCQEGTQPNGALYRICMPLGVAWNGELVVYAHGYVAASAPLALPEEADLLGPAFTLSGRAFATTSYRSNGAVVQDGIADLEELLTIFGSQQSARFIHHLIMWWFLYFVLVHIYLVIWITGLLMLWYLTVNLVRSIRSLLRAGETAPGGVR